jgi:uncharacterized protein
MKKNLPFIPLIKDPHAHAIVCKVLDFQMDTPSNTHYFELDDGDIMTYEVSEPKNKKILWTIVTLHGLCGSHKSAYNRRLTKRFVQMGYRVIRINLKGCGSSRGLTKGIYHSGCSSHILKLVIHFKEHYSESNFLQIGFSLGANVTLKMVGEGGRKIREILQGVIAISPPCDLFASNRRFSLPENAFLSRYFLRLLVDDVYHIHKIYDLGDPGFPEGMTLYDFDEYYVAPRANFKGALDYYASCSSMHVVENIRIPTTIQFAKDDPIIKHDSIDDKNLYRGVEVIKTRYGSHIGYVGLNLFKDLRWLDNRICEWAQDVIIRSKAS